MHKIKLLLAFFALGCATARAVAPSPYNLGVRFSCKVTAPATAYSNLSMSVAGQPGDHADVYAPVGAEGDSPIKLATWRPGKKYTVTLTGSDIAYYTATFIAPEGYDTYVDGLRSSSVARAGAGAGSPLPNLISDTYEVEIRPVGGAAGSDDAGAFSGIQLGQSISWNVGLGRAGNGRSVGRLSFCEFDLTNNPGNRSCLFYEVDYSPGITPDYLRVARDGGANKVPKQIMSPQTFIDIHDETDGYTLRFYVPDPATIHWNSGTEVYTVDAGAVLWKTIRVQVAGSPVTELKITETEDAVARISRLTRSGAIDSGNYTLTLDEGDASGWLRTTTHESTKSGSIRQDVVVVKEGSTVATKTRYTYDASFVWGEQVTSVTSNPDGPGEALTQTYEYYTSSANQGSYSRIRSVTEANGAWVGYVYHEDLNGAGKLYQEYHPWGNLPANPTSLLPASGRVISYSYIADWNGSWRFPGSVQEKINDATVSQTTTSSPTVGSIATIGVGEFTTYASTASGHTLTTISKSAWGIAVPMDQQDKTYSVKRPNGTQDSMSHYYGQYNPSTKEFTHLGLPWTHWREITWHGTTATGTGDYAQYDVPISYSFPAGKCAIEPIYLTAGKSTKEVLIRNLAGLVVRTEQHVYLGSGNFALIGSEDFSYDAQGRLLSRVTLNGATTEYAYTGGRLAYTIDSTGIRTNFTYDALGRVSVATKVGSPDLATRFTYNAANQVLTETVGYGQANPLVTTRIYDLSGRPTSVASEGLGASTISYNKTANTRTTTTPDGSTTIETYQLDGRLASVTGTGVVAQTYIYTIESGQLATEVRHGSASRYEKTWQDWLGRTVKTRRPGWNANSDYIEENTYHGTTGLLDKFSRHDFANNPLYGDVYYSYDPNDPQAQVASTGLDLNGDSAIVLASKDRVTGGNREIVTEDGAYWLKETRTIYATDNNSSPTTEQIVRTRLTNFTAGVQAEVRTTDIRGNVIMQQVAVVRGSKLVTTSETREGLSGTKSEVRTNGLVTRVTGYDGIYQLIGYDALGRPSTSTDLRTGVTTTIYVAGSRRPATISDENGTIATYEYDTSGRVNRQGDVDSKYTYISYNARGQLYRQWGDKAMPVEHGYDPTYGDHTTQTTYRAGTGWSAAGWPGTPGFPGSPGTGDVVTWAYDAKTGLLNSKQDALATTTFTYNTRGQTYERTWGRGVVTRYLYDGATGELTNETYFDGTPNVVYRYNRLGHTDQVTDATGTHGFDRCACGKVVAEHFDATFYAGRILTYLEDGTSAVAGSVGTITGRAAGFKLGTSGTLDGDLTQAYTHSDLGRIVKISTKVGAGTVRDFTYAYQANSALVRGYSTGSFTTDRQFDAHRNLVSSIDSTWGGNSLARFEYTYNGLNQRKTALMKGSVFADYTSGQSYTGVLGAYVYNARGELETSALYGTATPTPLPSVGDALPGRRFEYRYDNAGNRKSSGATGDPLLGDDEYNVADGTNRYASKENNRVWFAGTANHTASVAVSGVANLTRRDRAWAAEMTPANAGEAVSGAVTVWSADPGHGTAGADLVRSTLPLPWFVPKALQAFTYDVDGNLTNDLVWDYAYDAENRLILMQTRYDAIAPTKVPAANARKLEFKYDYAGRRVQKVVSGGWNGSSFTTVLSNQRYLYDGWNLVAEFDAISTLTLTRTYTWGLDLTGSLDASGGVGALLQIHRYTVAADYLPTYDGNGNVISLVDASSGVLAAIYEYGPFGEPLRDVKELKMPDNPFRFSTKFTDAETGLVYYGHRYYSATLGRFINRDPSGEAGGLNLYGFCGNDGVNRFDVLGLIQTAPTAGSVGSDDGLVGGGPNGWDGRVDGAPAGYGLESGGGYSSALDRSHPEPRDPAEKKDPKKDSPKKLDRWSDEKCADLAAQIADLKSRSHTAFYKMSMLNTQFSDATTIALAGLVAGVATDTAVIVGTGAGAAGLAARTAMRSSLSAGLTSQASYEIAVASSRAAFWETTSVVTLARSSDMAKGNMLDSRQSFGDKDEPVHGLGGLVQDSFNGTAEQMISNADNASRQAFDGLSTIRSAMSPRIAEYKEHCE